MSYAALALCLALLAYAAGMSVGSALALLLLRVALRAGDPAERARRLFLLRLLPAGLGAFLALALVVPSFLLLEPAQSGERIGWKLLLLATLSASVIVAGLARGALALLATRRLVRAWQRGARPLHLAGIELPAFRVDERFPLVALSGWLWPRLYVSNTVLEHCTSAELSAIVAHESGHLGRGDPWRSVLLHACPDLLALAPRALRIERRWAEAAEQAADDLASARGSASSLDLASALIRVARLAASSRTFELPMATLYRGGGVTERVRRLLEPRPAQVASRAGHSLGWSLLLAAGVAGCTSLLGALAPLHRVLEAVVSALG